MTTHNEHMKDLYGVGREAGGGLMQRVCRGLALEWATAQEAWIFFRYQFIDGISIGSGPAGFQCPEAELWNCCCSIRTWYDRDDPGGGGAFLRRTTAWGVLHNPPFFRWPNF